jgi:hypothetical protein
MALDTRSLVKVALAAVVLFALYKLVMDNGSCGGGYMNKPQWERRERYGEDEAEVDQQMSLQMDETQYYEAEDTYHHETYQDAQGYDDYEYEGEEEEAETFAELSEAMPPVSTSQMWGVATDLLPKSSVTQANFGEFAPTDALRGANFLDPVKFIGVDTQGSSLKNANYDLRTSLPITKSSVSPWLNSSYEPDLLRRPLE